MVWVYIALAIVLLPLLALQLLRFRFALDLNSPFLVKGTLTVTFPFFPREFALAAGGAHPPSSSPDAANEGKNMGGKGQRGGLTLPDSWVAFFQRLKRRSRAAAIKCALDFQVWRLLLGFLLKTGKRALGLLHPAMERLSLGLEDAHALGRIAAYWAVLQGTLPGLACPTEFRFAAPAFTLELRARGGFSGLNALWFCLTVLFSLPWAGLATRFIQCWRDPELN
ncbi:MAG: hypothetical protein ABI036_12390, partial [Fibrobacteria bacterium]